MMARTKAMERRMYFQRNVGSSVYVSLRGGRMVNMIGDLRWKLNTDVLHQREEIEILL